MINACSAWHRATPAQDEPPQVEEAQPPPRSRRKWPSLLPFVPSRDAYETAPPQPGPAFALPRAGYLPITPWQAWARVGLKLFSMAKCSLPVAPCAILGARPPCRAGQVLMILQINEDVGTACLRRRPASAQGVPIRALERARAAGTPRPGRQCAAKPSAPLC